MTDMTTIARRNLGSYISKASFAVNVDREAALNCLQALVDHIAAQEKRIAEMEALNASLVAHDPIQVCTDAWELTHEFCEDNCVSLYETEDCFAHAAVEYVLSRLAVSPPAPADAIDAERYRWLHDTLMSAVCGGVEVNDEKLSYQSSDAGEEVRVFWYPATPVGFCQSLGSNLDDAIDFAMKAAK